MSARIGHRLKSFTGTRHSELAVVWWAFRRSGKIQCTNEHGPVAQRERASLAWKRSGVRFPSGPPRPHREGPRGPFSMRENDRGFAPDPGVIGPLPWDRVNPRIFPWNRYPGASRREVAWQAIPT